jgi:hypothetical protein
MCFRNFDRLCAAWLSLFMRFESEGIRRGGVVVLAGVDMGEN